LLLEALPWCGQHVGGGDPAPLFPACSLEGGGLKKAYAIAVVTHKLPMTIYLRLHKPDQTI